MIAGKLIAFLTLDASGLLGGLKQSSSALTAFGSQVNIAATGMKGLALVGASSMIGLGREAVGIAADFESTTVAFETLSGSAEEARRTLQELTDLANTTPFGFSDLTKATQRLMAYGFTARESVGLVTKLGDLAAAAPDGLSEGMNRVALAVGQIRTKGKTATQELNQLAEAGIPVREALGKRLGVDVATAMKMVENGAVDARTGILAVLDLANDPKFAGMMARQSQTLNGLLSTMRDGWSMFLRELGQQIIEAFDLKGLVKDQTAFFEALRASVAVIRPVLDTIGSALKYIRDNIVDITEAVGKGLVQAFVFVAESIAKVMMTIQKALPQTAAFAPMRAGLRDAAVDLDKFAFTVGINGIDAVEKFAANWRQNLANQAAPAALAKNPEMEKLLQFDDLQQAKPAATQAPNLPSLAAGLSKEAVSIFNTGAQQSVPGKLDNINKAINERGQAQERALQQVLRRLEQGQGFFNFGIAN